MPDTRIDLARAYVHINIKGLNKNELNKLSGLIPLRVSRKRLGLRLGPLVFGPIYIANL